MLVTVMVELDVEVELARSTITSPRLRTEIPRIAITPRGAATRTLLRVRMQMLIVLPVGMRPAVRIRFRTAMRMPRQMRIRLRLLLLLPMAKRNAMRLHL